MVQKINKKEEKMNNLNIIATTTKNNEPVTNVTVVSDKERVHFNPSKLEYTPTANKSRWDNIQPILGDF